MFFNEEHKGAERLDPRSPAWHAVVEAFQAIKQVAVGAVGTDTISHRARLPVPGGWAVIKPRWRSTRFIHVD